MLKMANIELIRKLHLKEGRSIRQLAKDLGYSRQTIRKALEDSEIPTYARKAPYAKHSVGPYIPVITEWLISDRTAPTKQRHTAAQIYRRLVKEYEFNGGESTVRAFVRQLKQASAHRYFEDYQRTKAQAPWSALGRRF